MNFGDYYDTMDKLPDPGPRSVLTAQGEMEEALPKSFMGPEHMGTPLNPFQHQLAALNAKIKSGAGKIEFQFPGKGKGSSQAPTPESYGSRERRDIKELIDVTKTNTSIHATFGLTGFSGLGERGFSDYAQEENLKEIKKAIEFAAEATQGGAVVFHTGEYNRGPGDWNERQGDHAKGEHFQQFPNQEEFLKEGFTPAEQRNTMYYVVDKRTGQIVVNPVNETQKFYEPLFQTAADYEKETGKKVVGKKAGDLNRNIVKTDLVDANGNYLDPLDEKDMFKRVPHFKSDSTEFRTQDYTWEELKERTERYNKDHGTNLSPHVFKAKEDLVNRGLQQRASSIFYGQRYDEYQDSRKKLLEAKKTYEKLEASMPKDEVWRIMQQDVKMNLGMGRDLVKKEYLKPTEIIEKELQQVEDSIRHIHESSASADAQARESFQTAAHLDSMENVGKERTAEGIARMGIKAYEETKRWNPENPVYIAPENLWVGQYGSHPKEIIELTKKSRKAMVERLEARGVGKSQAKKLAKEHIKSTVDIGHLNMWKQYYKKEDPNVSPKQRDKEFKKWALKWTDKMIEEDVVGHIHVSDNFGYDDEHLTPGEGNAPIKDFLKQMEKKGYKDIIIEPGSFNPETILHDSWAYFDSPIYGARPTPGFRSVHQQHFGNQAPPFYVVGGYSPSNEWRLWSEVPLE